MNRINVERLSELAEKIGKLAKRAAKIGVPAPSFRLVGEVERVVKKDEDGWDVVSYYQQVEVEGSAPKINGWEFVATLEHDEVGCLVRVVPGKCVPVSYRAANPDNCDYCGKRRRRSNTYVIVNEKGDYKQIGSDCIRDFIGYDSPEQIANLIEALDGIERGIADGEYSEYNGPREARRYEVLPVIELAICAVRVHGWVPKSKAEEWGKTPTVAYVLDSIFEKKAEKKLPVSAEDVKQAEEVWNWGKEAFANPGNDYAHNMNLLVNSDSIKMGQFGLLCSLVGAWRKATMERIAKAAQPVSNYVGTQGKREEFDVEVLTINPIDSFYGTSYLVLFSNEGNIIKWFASSCPEFDKGDKLRIKASVAGHEEYKGVKQTSVKRVAKVSPKK